MTAKILVIMENMLILIKSAIGQFMIPERHRVLIGIMDFIIFLYLALPFGAFFVGNAWIGLYIIPPHFLVGGFFAAFWKLIEQM